MISWLLPRIGDGRERPADADLSTVDPPRGEDVTEPVRGRDPGRVGPLCFVFLGRPDLGELAKVFIVAGVDIPNLDAKLRSKEIHHSKLSSLIWAPA